jgi:hypothetical protein
MVGEENKELQDMIDKLFKEEKKWSRSKDKFTMV